MPRINIEDDILWNPRFQALTRRLDGDIEKAIGRLIRFWWAAQRHWGKDRNLVPIEEFSVGDFEHLVDVGLAEIRPEGVYARGAQEHFDWYLSRVKSASAAGKASAAVRKKKYGTAVPSRAKNRTSTERPFESVAERTEPNPNPLPLYMQDKTGFTENSDALEAEQAKIILSGPKGGDVWAAYAGAYFARYGTPPVRNALVNTQCKKLVQRLGGDAAIAVVRFYVAHSNAFYVQKAHPLGLCLSDAEGLHTQWKKQIVITQSSASHADKNSANHQAFKNVAARWAERDRKKGAANGEGE